jgi:5-methylthioadenosine/S-adenosylhomocysteine deaminase
MYYPADAAITAAQELGIRLVNTPTFFNAHGTPTDDIGASLPQCPNVATITQGLGPHSIYGCEEETLKAVRKHATENGLLIHIHVCETRQERVDCLAKTGLLPVHYLDSIGFLGPDVLIAHGVWITKGELDVLARHDVKVVHCPQSNMKLAGGGVLPLKEMQERNLTVCLGTDSTASNNSLDMFREMHVAALLHKHHYWDATIAPAQAVLDMATRNGASALRIDAGQIAIGKLADIITLDARAINLQPLAKERIVSHLVYAAHGGNVREVIVGGKVRS